MKSSLKTLIKRFLGYQSNKYKCSVCNNFINRYKPLPANYKIDSEKAGYKYFGQNEHLNVDQYSCPSCLANDRDRLYAAYFSNILKVNKGSKNSLLHVAPSKSLNDNFLIDFFQVTTVDLMMPNVDINLDIENMSDFEDNKFDFIICSHVLEHVKNPDKALKELYRILRPNGKAILMVPVNPNIIDTLEDPLHVTKEQRLQNYGQEDHLRLFAKNDFMNRIKGAGFKLITKDISDFGKKRFKSLGLRDSSVLYIGEK